MKRKDNYDFGGKLRQPTIGFLEKFE